MPNMIEMIIGSIADFIFPYHCIGCSKTGTPLCVACLGALDQPFAHESPWILSLCSYKNDLSKNIIHHLKKYPNRRLAHIMAQEGSAILIEELSDRLLFESVSRTLLIPVPIHADRFGERGFNQSLLHAKELTRIISRSVRATCEEVLTKTKKTPKQALIRDKKRRLISPRGSIHMIDRYRDIVSGAHCILVDDVSTTGATLAECKRVLLQHGAKRVIGYTIAH